MGFAGEPVRSAPNDPLFALVAFLFVIAALVIVLATSKTPRERTMRLLFLYLAYGTLEVAVKRLTHFAWYVYPLKFGLFGAVVVSWWLGRREMRVKARRPMVLALSLYLALAAVQIFNPNQSSPLIGILGWMTDYMYAALFFVAFELFQDDRDVRRLVWLTVALGVISATSCVLEMWSGAEEWQRLYPTFVPLYVYTDSGQVLYRPTSLVPYMEVFGLAAMVSLLALKGFRVTPLLFAIGLCVSSVLLHALRITWIFAFLYLALFTLLGRRRNWVSAFAVVLCAAGAIQLLDLGNSLVSNQLQSMTTPMETFRSTRLSGVLEASDIISRYPVGVGVGETSPGLRFLGSRPGSARFASHNYLTDLTGQMSVLGPVLLVAFGIGIAYRGVRELWRPARSDAHAVMLKTITALFCAMLISFFGGGALVAYPSTEYFWLAAGIIGRLTLPAGKVRRLQPARVIGGAPLFQPRSIRIVGRRWRARA
jgi:hypothetical protein